MFVGNDGGVTSSGGPGAVVVRRRLPDRRQQARLHRRPRGRRRSRKLHELFASKSAAARRARPTGGTRPRSPRAWRRCSGCGLWAMPGIQKALGDDFGVVAVPEARRAAASRRVSPAAGRSCVSAKSANVDAAKKFVKWLWIDKHRRTRRTGRLSYGFHIPPRKSLAAKAAKLQSGAGRRRGQADCSDYGVRRQPGLDAEDEHGVRRRCSPTSSARAPTPPPRSAKAEKTVNAELDAAVRTERVRPRRRRRRRHWRSGGGARRQQADRRRSPVRSGCSSGRSSLGLLIFVYLPIVWSLVLSFFEARNTVTPAKFVGLRQLRRHAHRPGRS